MSDEKRTLEEQAREKIEEMEAPDYEFPERFPKRDYIYVIAGLVISAAALIIGAGIR